jgi:hypothetical protein
MNTAVTLKELGEKYRDGVLVPTINQFGQSLVAGRFPLQAALFEQETHCL